ncbi:MAG: hypothetical protein RLZZ148_658 [Cyanobacteriota bacterium]|jgi:hypothetical protein
MNLDSEISRLLDLMPATGRMLTKIVSRPQQSKVIDTPFPMPWERGLRPVFINFDLWKQLSRPERDLTLLRGVSVLTGVRWFKPDIYQGITLAGLVGLTTEIVQGDAVGIVVAGALTAIAGNRVWRTNRTLEREITADEEAIKVAIRRGYTQTEASRQLLNAIETIAKIEGRQSLSFTELIRSQNLKTMGNLSPVGVPDIVRQED